jgi:hypothetical protein
VFCANKKCRDYELTGFHAEFVDHITVCPTCGEPLISGPDPNTTESMVAENGDHTLSDGSPGAAPPMEVEPVLETADNIETEAARALLNSSWIPHLVVPWDQLGRLRDSQPQISYQPRRGALVFLVPTTLAEDAREVLAVLDEAERTGEQ